MLNSRSYAGMIRIRFKGPAQRHLSIVRCPPRNKAMMRRRMTEVNAQAIFWSLLSQHNSREVIFTASFQRVLEIWIASAAIFPAMLFRLTLAV